MSSPLLVVDVQPAYHTYCDYLMPALVKKLNATRNPVTFLWVGDGITTDSQAEVYSYYVDHGVSFRVLDAAYFVEKGYGYIRSAMDSGVEDADIFRIIRAMRRHCVHDARMLPEDVFEECADLYPGLIYDSLFIPYSDVMAPLVRHSRWSVCGGGSNECLREIELLLKGHGVGTERVDGLVYG